MKWFSVIFLLMLPLVVMAKPELKGSPDELRNFLYPSEKVVSLRATAEEKAYADQAIITLVVTTEEKNLSDAMSSNSKIRADIVRSLVASGINESDIKSAKFSTSPQYGWFGKKPDAYKAVNRMSVTITTEKQLLAVAKVSDDKEAVELASTKYEHTKKSDYQQKVKQKALDKIMKEKDFYEKSLGVSLKTIGIRDVNFSQRPTRAAMQVEEVVVTARKSSSSMAYDSAPPRPTSFDEVTYEAQLFIDFSIDTPKK